ncbi:MAG: helix-turn-helix transcriptional regulator, partial [Cyanobacteria bacterium P01_H01_bin.26]
MKDKNNSSTPQGAYSLAQTEHSNVELDLRTELGRELRKILIEKRLKQRELATLLAVQQPEVSHLFNGHFTRFTTDRLIQFLNRLGWIV